MLDELKIERPWLVIGDFNCVLRGEGQSLGRGISSCFVEWVEQRGHIDLGFVGPIFFLRVMEIVLRHVHQPDVTRSCATLGGNTYSQQWPSST